MEQARAAPRPGPDARGEAEQGAIDAAPAHAPVRKQYATRRPACARRALFYLEMS